MSEDRPGGGSDGSGGRRERTAGELMRAGAAAVDPELAGRLRAFFTEGGPAYKPPPKWELPPGWELPEEDPEAERRRQEALDAVDPRLLRRLDRTGARLPASPEPPRPTADPSVARFDLDDWNLTFAGDPRELARSAELTDALQECAPQAVLRDLHRPVIAFRLALHTEVLVEGGSPRDEARQAMAADYRVRPHDLTPGRRLLAEGIEERRHWIKGVSWAECKPATPMPKPSFLPDANDLKWFGR